MRTHFFEAVLLNRAIQSTHEGSLVLLRSGSGRATERQDRYIPLAQRVPEESEELRLSLCQMVGRMVVGLMDRGTIGVVRPYFDDIILFLVSWCNDLYSAVKVEALGIIAKMAADPRLEQVRWHVLQPLKSDFPNSKDRFTTCKNTNSFQRQKLTVPFKFPSNSQGMKFYAVGLSRMCLPHLRHRWVLLDPSSSCYKCLIYFLTISAVLQSSSK